MKIYTTLGNMRPPTYDPSNRYRTPTSRFVGTRNGQRSKYAKPQPSMARVVWRGSTARKTGNPAQPYTTHTMSHGAAKTEAK
jgi:hypothetical protein